MYTIPNWLWERYEIIVQTSCVQVLCLVVSLRKSRQHGVENWSLCCRTRASLVAQIVKNQPALQETRVQSLGQEDALEKGMTTHPSILAWRIPWTEEPAGLQSMQLQSWTQHYAADHTLNSSYHPTFYHQMQISLNQAEGVFQEVPADRMPSQNDLKLDQGKSSPFLEQANLCFNPSLFLGPARWGTQWLSHRYLTLRMTLENDANTQKQSLKKAP